MFLERKYKLYDLFFMEKQWHRGFSRGEEGRAVSHLGYIPELCRIENFWCLRSLFSHKVVGITVISRPPRYTLELGAGWYKIKQTCIFFDNYHPILANEHFQKLSGGPNIRKLIVRGCWMLCWEANLMDQPWVVMKLMFLIYQQELVPTGYYYN